MCAGWARDSPDFKKEFPKDITIPVARLQELVYQNAMRFRFSLCLPLLATGFCQGAPDPLKSLENCRFVPTPWADGDSFLVRTKDGGEMTVRLYGADCIEFHVTDDTDARRLREQRRYFGIAESGGSPEKSISLAKRLGGLAARETAKQLAAPFTVHTAFSDARGDGKHKRIYGFVETSDGKDLSEQLVSKGLARAFGVYRETPLGVSGKDYRAQLEDLELRAAKTGAGAWAETDWDKLPFERGEQRTEDTEMDLATGAKREFSGTPINVNTAARDELMTLPGIGETTANRIIGGRPYKSLAGLDEVEGIGEKTLERLGGYLRFGETP